MRNFQMSMSLPARHSYTAFVMIFILTCLTFSIPAAHAQAPNRFVRYALPESGDLIGSLYQVSAKEEDTLIDIAARFRLGYEAMRAANPDVDAWLPGEGTLVTLPTQHLLPGSAREGIVVNIAEMRLYYFPKPKKGEQAHVEVYAISIGRGDWSTPVTDTKVVAKIKDPVWYPPASIRAEHAQNGKILPMQVPPGPNNPLGQYVIQLDIPSYFIHGTDKLFGIGMQVTHGCMRMYPDDIERLALSVAKGAPVRIINQRYKTGWLNGELYMEVHPKLEISDNETATDNVQETQLATEMTSALISATKGLSDYAIDWNSVEIASREARGIPVKVAKLANSHQASVQQAANHL